MITIVAQYTSDFQSEDNGRFTEIAKYLSSIDDVEIVTSAFSHSLKKKKKCMIKPKSYKLTLIEAPAYKKNISIRRMWSCKIFACNIKSYLNKKQNIKLVYCAVPSLEVGKVVTKYCKKNSIPMILDIQDLWPDAFFMVCNIPFISPLIFFPYQKMANKIYKSANYVIAVSETYLSRATKTLNHSPEKCLVTYLGTSLSKFDQISKKTSKKTLNEEITVVYIGTLSYSYDINLVINAINIVQNQCDKVINFLIMGDGPLKNKFVCEANKYNIRATFTGKLSYSEMVELLVETDIAVNPIVKNSAGSIINKVGDYAAAGLPVINSQECVEYRDLIEKYNCGINCKNGDLNDFSNALLWMILHPQERKQMGRNARKMAEELFDRDKSYENIQQFVRSVYESTNS